MMVKYACLIVIAMALINAQFLLPSDYDKIVVYIYNRDTDRPGQTTILQFWHDPHDLDMITIQGNSLVNHYINVFNQMPTIDLFDGDEEEQLDDFDYSYAFILRRHQTGEVDTIYSGHSLGLFKHRNMYYLDPSGIIRKGFLSFRIY